MSDSSWLAFEQKVSSWDEQDEAQKKYASQFPSKRVAPCTDFVSFQSKPNHAKNKEKERNEGVTEDEDLMKRAPTVQYEQ